MKARIWVTVRGTSAGEPSTDSAKRRPLSALPPPLDTSRERNRTTAESGGQPTIGEDGIDGGLHWDFLPMPAASTSDFLLHHPFVIERMESN